MGKHLLRFSLMLVTFGVGVLLAAMLRPSPQREFAPHEFAPLLKQHPSEPDTLAEKVRFDAILAVLIKPGNWVDSSQLHRYRREEVIKALRTAKEDASGERAVAIAYLLAAVRDDYEVNKSKLVDKLATCRNKPYPEASNCAYLVADYLIDLGRRGDPSVLPPLFAVSDIADGGFSQSLGAFYSEALTEYPVEFLTALKSHSSNEQENLCRLAGLEDGSGMNQPQYLDAKRRLSELSYPRNSPIARLAKKCLSSIERARTTADGMDNH